LHLYTSTIPHGDILIHSGDFADRRSKEEHPVQFKNFLQTFQSLPHKHKVFIAGNHDYCLDGVPREQVQQLLGPDVHYLLDSGVTILGLNIYGSPWTTSTRMAFSAKESVLQQKFTAVPRGTDILITHIPPLAVLDLAGCSSDCADACPTCGRSHPYYSHWGSPSLRHIVETRGIPLVLFGHVHEWNGYKVVGKTVCMNSAMDCTPKSGVVKLYARPQEASAVVNAAAKPVAAERAPATPPPPYNAAMRPVAEDVANAPQPRAAKPVTSAAAERAVVPPPQQHSATQRPEAKKKPLPYLAEMMRGLVGTPRKTKT